ncbi:hypothetical protein Pcinc_028172 [Petrolisthes cinctipes]|uniref:Uncharacterized protein n=1 Tax=Petrolisthes cinctipes TaxID=88211 RepID=A0AAE1F2W7_PETCI|nr:hypothetical protein Pcinc_028172 [Petrolisthes cinctipes]
MPLSLPIRHLYPPPPPLPFPLPLASYAPPLSSAIEVVSSGPPTIVLCRGYYLLYTSPGQPHYYPHFTLPPFFSYLHSTPFPPPPLTSFSFITSPFVPFLPLPPDPTRPPCSISTPFHSLLLLPLTSFSFITSPLVPFLPLPPPRPNDPTPTRPPCSGVLVFLGANSFHPPTPPPHLPLHYLPTLYIVMTLAQPLYSYTSALPLLILPPPPPSPSPTCTSPLTSSPLIKSCLPATLSPLSTTPHPPIYNPSPSPSYQQPLTILSTTPHPPIYNPSPPYLQPLTLYLQPLTPLSTTPHPPYLQPPFLLPFLPHVDPT